MATGMSGEPAGANGRVGVGGGVSRYRPRSVRLWRHARGPRAARVAPTGGLGAAPGMPACEARSTLYVSSGWVTTDRRASRAQLGRQLLALRILIVAWAVAIVVTGWISVDFVGWEFAACSQAPMVLLLAVLVRTAGRTRRSLLTWPGRR